MKRLFSITALFGFVALVHGQGTNLTITAQPQSQTVPLGGTATFSVIASGAGPLIYQWQFDGTNLPDSIITTVAGNGGAGYSGDGGPATNASLNVPEGVAVDAFGNLFFGDTYNFRVRMVSPAGVITTVAGNGNSAYSGDGGPATNAAVNHPVGVAVDGSGNLLVAQSWGQRIRKVGTNGIITTFAGNGAEGFSGDGGPATNASLDQATGVTLDGSGNIFIADYYNNRIRKVDTNGIITTVAGSGPTGINTGGYSGDSGPATSARLSSPYSTAVDSSGNLFIADTYNFRIRKVSTNGVITTFAGNGTGSYSGDHGPATNAGLSLPVGIVVDASGNVYIGDNGNNRIRKVDTNGIISTVAGNGTAGFSGDGGLPTNAELTYPNFVTLDAAGNLVFSDQGNNRIRKLVASSAPTLTIQNVATNNAGNYTVIVSDASQSVTSSVAVLHVNSSIVVNGHLAAGTVYSPDSALVSFINGFPSGFFFYTLDGSTPTTGSTLYFGPFTLASSATVQVLTVNSNDTQSVLSPQVAVQIGTAPTITMSPSNVVVAAGTPLLLTVSASGTAPLAYQWSRSSGVIAGATDAVFSVDSVSTNDADNYFAVVSNPYGAATSAVATVTVYVPVTITSQPTNVVVPLGGTASFSVSAYGYPAPTYQWSINSTNLPGATSPILTINRVQLTNLGGYQVLVSNAYSSQISSPAMLNMSPSITVPFGGTTAIWGQTAVLSVGAVGSGTLSYQWYLNGVAVATATNAVFTLNSVQFTNAGLYTVVVSSAYGSVTNAPALLVVNPAGTSIGIYAGVTLTGTSGYTYVIQYTTDLSITNSWVTLTNLTLDQPVEIWVDTTTNALASPRRFYQVLPGQ